MSQLASTGPGLNRDDSARLICDYRSFVAYSSVGVTANPASSVWSLVSLGQFSSAFASELPNTETTINLTLEFYFKMGKLGDTSFPIGSNIPDDMSWNARKRQL